MPSYVRMKPNKNTPALPEGFKWTYKVKQVVHDNNAVLLEVSICEKKTLTTLFRRDISIISMCAKLDSMFSDSEMEEEIVELELAAVEKMQMATS